MGETWIIDPPGPDYRVLEKACVDAAKQWTFRPPRENGKPRAFKVEIPFVYSFEDQRWSYTLRDLP